MGPDMTRENTAKITYSTFGLVNADVELLFETLVPPEGARGVIINFLKSSFVIGCSDLKRQLIHFYV